MWTYNEQRGECYLHQFSSSQPDFNYRVHYQNITREMFQILTYWMDVGVDGFRMHGINQLYESASFTQETPINPDGDLTRYDNFRNIYSRDLVIMEMSLASVAVFINLLHSPRKSPMDS
jgi:alpha-glucosidase